MTAYLYLYVAFSVMSLFSLLSNSRLIKLIFFSLAVVVLILFAGLREEGVGADDLSYINKFHEIPDISYWFFGDYNYSFANAWMEPAYIFLGACLKYFTTDYIYLFLLIATLSVGFASYNYYRYTHYVFFALLLFYVHTYLYRDLNQIRSAVAAALGLFLVFSLHHKQHLKSTLIIFFAAMFHMAALSYFVVFILSFFGISRKFMVLGVIFSVAVGAIGISYIILNALPGMGFVTEKLSDYADSGYAESVKLFDITNIKNLFIFSLCIFFWKDLSRRAPYFQTLMLFYFVAVCWRILFNDFGIFAARISTFFAVVEVILIPAFLYIFRHKVLVGIVIILYASLIFYLNVYVKEGRYPYVINTILTS